MLDEARFCRKCGQPSTRFKEESVTEGTTRILEAPEHNKVFSQESNEQHGSLAQPTTRMPPQANETSRNLMAEPKRQNWVLIGSLLFAGFALIATILFFALRGSSTPNPSVVIKRQIPQPVQPPHPPSVPQGIDQGSSAISPDLFYPGAEVTMKVTDPNEGDVLQLRTSDSIDKVVNWYTEKLKPTRVVKGGGGNVVLNSDQMTAVIHDDGSGGVTILLHQGND